MPKGKPVRLMSDAELDAYIDRLGVDRQHQDKYRGYKHLARKQVREIHETLDSKGLLPSMIIKRIKMILGRYDF